jgi:hypothetical protein
MIHFQYLLKDIRLEIKHRVHLKIKNNKEDVQIEISVKKEIPKLNHIL